jgi:hypothetical protein
VAESPADPELTSELIERRWFAALAAAKTLKGECDVLFEVLQLAEQAWRRASAQLAELEMLRDALGDQVAGMDEARARPCGAAIPLVVSAA